MSLNKEQAEHMLCSWGILSVAETDGQDTNVTSLVNADLLAKIIKEQYPDRVPTEKDSRSIITHFNDHVDTQWEDVERMFQKAEVAWDEQNL